MLRKKAAEEVGCWKLETGICTREYLYELDADPPQKRARIRGNASTMLNVAAAPCAVSPKAIGDCPAPLYPLFRSIHRPAA